MNVWSQNNEKLIKTNKKTQYNINMDELMKSDEMKKVLENALSNETNERITQMSREKIDEYKNKLFDELNISNEQKEELKNSLRL